jgi:hypothetical protein
MMHRIAEWWPETGSNRRRRPFQGGNKQYLQLLTCRMGPPKYAEIRLKRGNHGWEFHHCLGEKNSVLQ